MTDPRWTPETGTLVMRTIAEHEYWIPPSTVELRCTCGSWFTTFDYVSVSDAIDEHNYHRRTTILAALADAGLLVEAGRAQPDADDPTDADLEVLASHPLGRVWRAGVDAATSADFRTPDGEVAEGLYVRYALTVMNEVLAEVTGG